VPLIILKNFIFVNFHYSKLLLRKLNSGFPCRGSCLASFSDFIVTQIQREDEKHHHMGTLKGQ